MLLSWCFYLLPYRADRYASLCLIFFLFFLHVSFFPNVSLFLTFSQTLQWIGAGAGISLSQWTCQWCGCLSTVLKLACLETEITISFLPYFDIYICLKWFSEQGNMYGRSCLFIGIDWMVGLSLFANYCDLVSGRMQKKRDYCPAIASVRTSSEKRCCCEGEGKLMWFKVKDCEPM